MIEVTAPGKLMLSGEWSVLEMGNPAIVLAVDKKAKAKISQNESIIVTAEQVGVKNAKAVFDSEKIVFLGLTPNQEKGMVFVKTGMETALRYLTEKKAEIKGFHLETDSAELHERGEKLGFGSSAAITTAVVSAVLLHHGIKPESDELFKLSTLAHYFAQGKIGSGFDVAASVLGGALFYTRFDPGQIEHLALKPVTQAVAENWPGLGMKRITLPKNIFFLAINTGEKADTRELVTKMKTFRAEKKHDYFRIINAVGETTISLAQALENNQEEKIISLVKKNRLLLKELGEKSGIKLETTKLTKIIEEAEILGCAAKFSGAGGGDNAIAVGFGEEKKQELLNAFKNKGFRAIETSISKNGVGPNA
ncbi:MAG: phosphomevalonate kinase [Candidatus Diapherotrites archaeon]|nr:phosphomevalonate kinase [Candidatus Diapherotrites archaeon]